MKGDYFSFCSVSLTFNKIGTRCYSKEKSNKGKHHLNLGKIKQLYIALTIGRVYTSESKVLQYLTAAKHTQREQYQVFLGTV